MIDWIFAERIARYVAGTGDAAPPIADLSELARLSEPFGTSIRIRDGVGYIELG